MTQDEHIFWVSIVIASSIGGIIFGGLLGFLAGIAYDVLSKIKKWNGK